MLNPFLGELVGTAILMLLGNGATANVMLGDTKGVGSGWIVIAWGWGMALFVAVLTIAAFSGAHVNPAVTLGLAIVGKFPWADVPGYVVAQFIGSAIGTTLVWLVYRDHFARTDNADVKLAVFCTAPAIRSPVSNLISEAVATFMLVFAVLFLAVAGLGLHRLDAFPVGLVLLAIGLSLGGATGYAINPARDLAPRAMHALLPIPGKRDSDWGYAWIPVVGPLIGAGVAALAYLLLQEPLNVNVD